MTAKSSATRTSPLDALIGVRITFLKPIDAFKNVYNRGDTVVLDAASIDSTIDRLGYSWLSMLDDEDAQTRRWGMVAFTRAESLDALVEPWEYGDATWERDRGDARREAALQPEGPLRKAAFEEVERRFGPAPSGTTILREIRGDDGQFRGVR